MVSILSGLARLLVDTQRLDEAAGAYSRAVDIGTRALPPRHPNLATVQLGLAAVYARTGRCDQALELHAEYGSIVEASATSILEPCQ